MKNLGTSALLCFSLIASVMFSSTAAADYKVLPGSGCDGYGGTNTSTYKTGRYIYTNHPRGTNVYTNIYCPIVRDNTTAGIKDVWVNFSNDTDWQTCYLTSSQRSGSGYVVDTESIRVAPNYDGTLRFTANSLDNYRYGAYQVNCTMNAGDRLYNIYWNE